MKQKTKSSSKATLKPEATPKPYWLKSSSKATTKPDWFGKRALIVPSDPEVRVVVPRDRTRLPEGGRVLKVDQYWLRREQDGHVTFKSPHASVEAAKGAQEQPQLKGDKQ